MIVYEIVEVVNGTVVVISGNVPVVAYEVLVLVGPAAVFSVECVNCTQTSFTKLVNVSAVVFRDAGRNVPLPCAPCVPVHPHFIYFAHHLPVFRIAILSSVFSTSIMA